MTRILILSVALIGYCGIATSQSVEFYAGHQRSGVDIMWFRNFRNFRNEASPLLFFSRNRASVDNGNAAFGSTNAVSWNFRSGIGLVAVGSFLGGGFTPKAGLQYYRQRGDLMCFGWLVADLQRNGNVDLFGMFRYSPAMRSGWRIFSQLELFPVYRTATGTFHLTQRLRVGPRYKAWATGLMVDLNRGLERDGVSFWNTGGFLRYDF